MGSLLRAALYSRVSTDEQAERGTSLHDQERRTRAYCVEQGWDVVEQHVDDGESGATTARPALQRLIASARARRIDVVVVTDPDRLSRDLVDGLTVERDLTACGVAVVYLVQPAMGTLERQLRGVIAEEERRKIRERTSRGLRSVATAGFWPGGPAPYGYRAVKLPQGHTRLEIDESEADTLRAMITALVDERLTSWELASLLNHREVPTPSAGRKLSKAGSGRWTHRRVRETLSSARAIAGSWTYRTKDGAFTIAVPAIVSETRLAQLQLRLAETSTGANATKAKHFFLLSRRVTSPCGHPMHGYCRPDGTGRAYRCSMSTADRGPQRCDCPRASADIIDTATWENLTKELTDPDRLATLVGLIPLPAEPDPDADIGALDRKIRRVERAAGTQVAELLSRGTDPAIVTHATAKLEDELRMLREHRARLLQWAAMRAESALHADRLKRFAQSARQTLLDPTNDTKKQVVEILDISVTVVDLVTCSTCAGRGLLPRSTEVTANRRHLTGDICPQCNRRKRVPIIEIHGYLPATADLRTTLTDGAIPFTLRSVG